MFEAIANNFQAFARRCSRLREADNNRRAAGAVGFCSRLISFSINQAFWRLTARRRGILYVIPLFNLQLSFSENGLNSPSEEKGKVAGSRFSVTVEVFSLPFEAGKSRRHHLERHFDSARNRNRAGEMPPLPCFAPQTVQLSGPRAAFCKMGRGQASLL